MKKYTLEQQVILRIIGEKAKKEYVQKIVNRLSTPSPEEGMNILENLINSNIIEESNGFLKIKNGFQDGMYSSIAEEIAEYAEKDFLENDS